MALAYLFDPNIQNQTLGGVNNVGGFLRVYIDGTDDRATTYKDFNGTLNKADIELDANGRAVVVVDDTRTYRMEVYSRDGFFMWSVTNLTARGSVGGSGDTVVVDGTPDEIDVTPNQVGGFMHYVVSLAAGIKSALSTMQETVNTLASSLRNKKDRQTAKEFLGGTTKTVVGVTQNEDGEIDVQFGDVSVQAVYVTTDDSWEDVDTAYSQGRVIVLHHDGRFYTLNRTDLVGGGVLQYIFYAFPDEVQTSGNPAKIDSYSVKYMRCRLDDNNETVWENPYSSAGSDEKKVYSAYKSDQLLATKTPILGWTRGVADSSAYNLRWFKICEAPAPSVGADLYSTTFEIVCGTDYNGKALDSGVFEVSVYGDKVQGRWLTYTAPGIDKYHINRVSVTVNTKLEVFVEMRDFSNHTFIATALSNTGMIANRSVFTYENGIVNETTAPYGSTSHFPTAPSLPSTVMDADEIVLSRWYAYDSIQNSMDENKPVVVRVASKDKSYLITSRDVSGTTKYFYGVAFDNANTDFEVLRLEYDTAIDYTWTYSFITKVCENKAKGQLFVFDISEFVGSTDEKRTLFANIANAVKNKGTVIMQEYGDYLNTDIGQYEEWAQWHLVSYRELQSGSNVLEFDKGFTYIAGGKVQFTRKTVTYVRSSALVTEQDVDYPVDVSY